MPSGPAAAAPGLTALVRPGPGVSGRDAMRRSAELMIAVGATAGPSRVMSVYRPAPTVAFSRRETRRAAWSEAVEAALGTGYEPVVRLAGGQVVAYDEGCVVLDVIQAADDPGAGSRERFVDLGGRLVGALRRLGADARLGPVPDEYCPGDFSVNLRGEAKVAGTAQRVGLRAWLWTAVVVVQRRRELLDVLERTHGLLGYQWASSRVGALADAVSADVDTVIDALSAEFAEE